MNVTEVAPFETERLCECVFDITATAIGLRLKGEIRWEDSRDLFQCIYNLAKEYESTSHDGDDYMAEIEEFAEKRLREVLDPLAMVDITLEYGK